MAGAAGWPGSPEARRLSQSMHPVLLSHSQRERDRSAAALSAATSNASSGAGSGARRASQAKELLGWVRELEGVEPALLRMLERALKPARRGSASSCTAGCGESATTLSGSRGSAARARPSASSFLFTPFGSSSRHLSVARLRSSQKSLPVSPLPGGGLGARYLRHVSTRLPR